MRVRLALLALGVVASLSTSAVPNLHSQCGQSGAAILAPSPAASDAGKYMANVPLFFTRNHGRYADGVRFFVEHSVGAVLFKDDSVVFRSRVQRDLVLEFPRRESDARVHASADTATVAHYLIGSEGRWQTDVPTYRLLRYADLWPGIDLVVRGERGRVKYEFQVAPFADPGRIRMRYFGQQLVLNAAGSLVVKDESGVRHEDAAPVAFQSDEHEVTPVASSFVLDGRREDTVGFLIGEYDRTRRLTIDPAFLVYSGYLVPGMVNVYDVAVDSKGAALVAGIVTSPDFTGDACIAKVRPDGTGFEFITFIGGSKSSDLAMGVAVDATGIYVAGHTNGDETVFPVKVGPDLTFNNKGQVFLDCFVCKLALDGKTVAYCGYVGGNLNDGLREGACAVDSKGAFWIAGQTTSTNYPTVGGPQLKMPGTAPACVTKVAPDGKSILLSGYVGGGTGHPQHCAGVAVDGNDDAYITGVTGSDQRTFPVKVGPLTKWQGGLDVFVGKINGKTGAYVYRGYIGGSLDEHAWNIAVDSSGAAYVVGRTYSDESTFPVVGGPVTKAVGSSRVDGFVAKIKPDGGGFDYSGFLGGVEGKGVSVDSRNRCYVGGETYGKPNLPVGGALSSTLPSSTAQFCGFLLRLSSSGKLVEYAGYLGGAKADTINAVELDSNGVVYVAGQTWSNGTFPLMTGPNSTYNLGKPAPSPNLPGTFVAKIAEASIVPSGSGRIGTALSFNLLANDDPGLAYVAGTSMTKGPIPLGNRSLGLGAGPLLQVSAGGLWPTVFQGYSGLVGASGTATATVRIPNHAGLVGLRLHTAFITLDGRFPLGIKSISDTAAFTVLR